MNWTKAKLTELKSAYNEALKNNQEYFIFNNGEFLVSYAKYLIAYLETLPLK